MKYLMSLILHRVSVIYVQDPQDRMSSIQAYYKNNELLDFLLSFLEEDDYMSFYSA